jgi:hypothetical protein
MVGCTVLAMVATGYGMLTGAAMGAGTGHTEHGALIGTGVGAAADAMYDATRPYPYDSSSRDGTDGGDPPPRMVLRRSTNPCGVQGRV